MLRVSLNLSSHWRVRGCPVVRAPQGIRIQSLEHHTVTWLCIINLLHNHYSDVIMSPVASKITSLTIVYSSIYSGADHRKHQSSASLAPCVGNSPVTGEFPAQRASNAENVSIWWCHHNSKSDSDVETRFSLTHCGLYKMANLPRITFSCALLQ